VQTLDGHGGIVNFATFSPDDRFCCDRFGRSHWSFLQRAVGTLRQNSRGTLEKFSMLRFALRVNLRRHGVVYLSNWARSPWLFCQCVSGACGDPRLSGGGVEVLKFDHEWSVNSASFSLDGHLLVTASDDLAQTIGR